jgi:hypothetical protein
MATNEELYPLEPKLKELLRSLKLEYVKDDWITGYKEKKLFTDKSLASQNGRKMFTLLRNDRFPGFPGVNVTYENPAQLRRALQEWLDEHRKENMVTASAPPLPATGDDAAVTAEETSKEHRKHLGDLVVMNHFVAELLERPSPKEESKREMYEAMIEKLKQLSRLISGLMNDEWQFLLRSAVRAKSDKRQKLS